MKKSILLAVSFLFFLSLSAQEKFEVPEYKTTGLHKRSVVLGHSIVINAISIAKASGMSVEELATKMGDNWATTWNKDAGFSSLVNGTIWNHSSFLSADHPKVEIIDQQGDMVKLKVHKTWLPMFQNGPVFDVTESELTQFWNIAGQRIADYMGAKQEMEDTGDYVVYSISKK